MLVCRACNTRYEQGRDACPSCGRRSSRNANEAGADSGPLPPGASLAADAGEIDLGEDSVVASEARRARGKQKAKAKSAPAPAKPAPAPAEIAAGPEQVKSLLGEQPGLLEKGLGLHCNEDGEPVGIDFPTPVGSIDLLTRDRKGGFVVVHLPAPDEVGDSVSAMLRRMGWARKHLAEDGENVRGVVVLDQLPEDLVYAAAGAGGSISFKSCQLSLSFHELDA